MRGNEQVGDGTIRYPRRNIVAVTLLLFVTGLSFIALFNLMSATPSSQTSADGVPSTSTYVTITGNRICLPHKGVKEGDVITLECAIGLKGDDGRNYALTGSTNEIASGDFNQRIKVRGILNEADSKSKYDISGSLEVQSYTNQ